MRPAVSMRICTPTPEGAHRARGACPVTGPRKDTGHPLGPGDPTLCPDHSQWVSTDS